jgi:hypothetical protein
LRPWVLTFEEGEGKVVKKRRREDTVAALGLKKERERNCCN